MAQFWIYLHKPGTAMIITDFKIAIRNITRNKVQSTIGILGLGIGLGSIILLMALIVHENSFDKYIPGFRNVNRIVFGQSIGTAFPLTEEMNKEFPEVKGYFRFFQALNVSVGKIRGEMVFENSFGFADTSIFRILGISLISGQPAVSFDQVTISERTALKYFGNNSPLGTILMVKLNPNEIVSLSVSGVYKDFPPNSTLDPGFIAGIKLSEKMFVNFKTQLGEYGGPITTSLNWDNMVFLSYVVLNENTDKEALASKMQKYTELIGNENNRKLKYTFQPVHEIYLKSSGLTGGDSAVRVGNANEIKYYWAISFLILLISVTNYIFLTRAATADRLKELGTRKVLGASRFILHRQILVESILVTLLSLFPATFVISSGMSFINKTLNRTLSNEVFSYPAMWLFLISAIIITGTVSGLLIGYRISKISPLLLLSGKTTEKSRSRKWDFSFLIFHFSIYIVLVASVLCVTKQIKYSMTNFTGINPRNVFYCNLNSPKLQAGFKTICSELEKMPGVLKVAGSSFIPPFNYFLPITLANPSGEKERFDGLIMGEGMTELLGIELVEGSPFSAYQVPSQPAPMEVLFNESSAKKYNVKSGEIYLGVFHVRGIVKDFNAHSTHSPIQPLVIIQQNPSKIGIVAVKTDGSNDRAVIARLREIYTQVDPGEIFEVNYLTDSIGNFYTSERNQAMIIGAFSLLSTVLSIMGLFGVALISISRKTKEIGLRKVNGASVFGIIFMLNRDFLKWVLISIIVGIPLSVYLMSNWQNRFAYKTELSWWIFGLAGLSAVLVAILTISGQSWRAATRNPVEALRYE
jgi:putative ABC transport system permease protein